MSFSKSSITAAITIHIIPLSPSIVMIGIISSPKGDVICARIKSSIARSVPVIIYYLSFLFSYIFSGQHFHRFRCSADFFCACRSAFLPICCSADFLALSGQHFRWLRCFADFFYARRSAFSLIFNFADLIYFIPILFIILARYPAPNPLSIFTTLTPLAHEFNIDKSAARPLNDAP